MFERLKSRLFRLDIASCSDRGLVRADNQDHVLVNRRSTVFCVADGMGGGEGGAQASDIVCSEIASALSRRTGFSGRVRKIDDAIRTAHERIRKFAAEAGYRQMASTTAVLILDCGDDLSAVTGNVGDSRVYRFRDGKLVQLTRDHTMACEMRRKASAQGMRPAFDARIDHFSHVLTRAVGIGPSVKADWRKVEIAEGDAFLVCSDGLYGAVDAESVQSAFAAGGRAAEIAERLADRVVKGGAEDNYSFIVVKVGGRKA